MRPRVSSASPPGTHARDTFPYILEDWLESGARRVVAVVVISGGIALIAASQVYLNWRQSNVDADFVALFALKLVEWLLWAAMLPAILAMDRRWGFAAGRRLSAALLHIVTATVWFVLLNGIMTSLAPFVDPVAKDAVAYFMLRATQRWPNHLVVYSLILFVPRAISNVLQRERLHRELLEAQLHNIRLQLQPHFLFNALHTIGALVRSGETSRAVNAIAIVGDLLRRALSHTESEKVTVAEEVDFLSRYSEIQRLRFEERLELDVSVSEECKSALLPSMILQPLVENAIRHGLDPDQVRGLVNVSIDRLGDRLRVEVRDNGSGFQSGSVDATRDGLGLSTTRRRLQALYGDEQSLNIDSGPHGCTVAFSLPFET
jgi:two-component system, LytTR family, sensor kinase